MDTPEIRKLRAIERIKGILKEENCILQCATTIVGDKITDSQVIVQALTEPEKEEEKPVEAASVEIVETPAPAEGGTS